MWQDQHRVQIRHCIEGLVILISCSARESTNAAQLTSSLIAILDVPWSAIVASADDAFLPNQHTANAALHAVASLCSEVSKLHEVLIPAGTKPLLVCQSQRV